MEKETIIKNSHNEEINLLDKSLPDFESKKLKDENENNENVNKSNEQIEKESIIIKNSRENSTGSLADAKIHVSLLNISTNDHAEVPREDYEDSPHCLKVDANKSESFRISKKELKFDNKPLSVITEEKLVNEEIAKSVKFTLNETKNKESASDEQNNELCMLNKDLANSLDDINTSTPIIKIKEPILLKIDNTNHKNPKKNEISLLGYLPYVAFTLGGIALSFILYNKIKINL